MNRPDLTVYGLSCFGDPASRPFQCVPHKRADSSVLRPSGAVTPDRQVAELARAGPAEDGEIDEVLRTQDTLTAAIRARPTHLCSQRYGSGRHQGQRIAVIDLRWLPDPVRHWEDFGGL